VKKFLEKQMEKMRPLFLPGGKFERLYPLHEANETFLLTPAEVTHGAPHVRDQIDLKRAMIMVVLALIPATLFGIYNAGVQHHLAHQVADATFVQNIIQGLLLCLPIILVSYAVGGIWEVLFAVVRKHPVSEGFLVTGLLFPLTLPPTIPLWQVAAGVTFGVVIGKEIFGGTGFNVLNPALTARAFLYFAYPGQISGDRVWASGPDGWSGATPLGIGMVAHGNETLIESLNHAGYTLKSMIIGFEPGSIGETSVIACAIGAVILILSGVGSWRIMLGSLLGLAASRHLVPPRRRRQPQAAGHPALLLPHRHRQLRVRHRLHGHRPGFGGRHESRQVDLRLPDRLPHRADPGGQPGLSRSHDAGHPVHERAGAPHRPLRRAGPYQAESSPCLRLRAIHSSSSTRPSSASSAA
jgi:Na+-transporting NADH:ubiquinone oxidoreductase subunit B